MATAKKQRAQPDKPQQGGGQGGQGGQGKSAQIFPLQPFSGAEIPMPAPPENYLEQAESALKLPDQLDRSLHAWIARMTGGISPASVHLAFTDWLLHLSAYPARRQQLALDASEKMQAFGRYATARLSGDVCPACIEPEERDDRFEHEAWEQLPYALYAQSFLLAHDWWMKATQDVHGVSRHHNDIVRFMTRQWLDMLSPSNFLPGNPEVVDRTMEEGGQNLLRGLQHLVEDVQRFIHNRLPRGVEAFELGEDLATCKGKVVYRNDLMELIQYEPLTDKVHAEPMLIVPAWIMKYYILDLSPHNSMVKYLLEQGHTVFMISWKNPGREDARYGMRDYLKQGVLEAMDAVSAIVPKRRINAVGYCIGGTLLAIAAAYMTRREDARLNSLTLFTTQLDFEEAGELLMFIDASQLAYLEDLMWQQGYLEKWQLSGAFNMLRSKDLIWSRVVREYLKGEDEHMFDLLAWNADATRLPYKMHSEYLRDLYLNNDLAEHRYAVDDTPIHLSDIDVPVFAVATRKDHIAPWRSVYKMRELIDRTELTFVLTSGGHNAGIVSEPGHEGRAYQMQVHQPGDRYQSSQDWYQSVKEQDGSWWPAWSDWLRKQSGGKTEPPGMGAPRKGYRPLEDAPGSYVRIR